LTFYADYDEIDLLEAGKVVKYTAAIVGAQGYAGRELARLLLAHPQIKLTQVYSRNNEWSLADELPELAASEVVHANFDELYQTPPAVDIIFLATPHEVSLEAAQKLQQHIKWMVDLSGAFRLPAETFATWYQQPHTAENLLTRAQYGLCPWQKAAPKQIIANPGCYATAVLMALLPLAAQKLVDLSQVVIDAKSGITGAGRSAKTELLFGEINNNFFPYKIGKHQHTPEIQHAISEFTQMDTSPLLTTQILPIPRGISASIYIPCQNPTKDFIEQVNNAYQQAYNGYALVRHAYLPSLNPKEQQRLLALRSVVGSCRTHIAYQLVNDYLVIFSTLDNLLKGAASQAIENANRIFNLPLSCGLEQKEGIL
jgi:N-acetyl-gamma-glutamyl-phosphate reductase